MSHIKNALMEILECTFCNGQGFNAWATDEDFEFQFCECNPYHLDISDWNR